MSDAEQSAPDEDGHQLPLVVAEAVTHYEEVAVEGAEAREVKSAAETVVAQLHVIADTAAPCAERFYAHAMIAQIVGHHTDVSNTDQIGEILLHLAEALVIGPVCDEVPEESLRIAQSNQSTWLSQVAEQLDPNEVERVTARSEEMMRSVLANAVEGTRARVIRACNIASHLLSGGSKSGTTEAGELLEAQEDFAHLLSAKGEREYFRQRGNACRRAAHYIDDINEAHTQRQVAMGFYRRVEHMTANDETTTLYAEIALLMSESGEDIDDVIATAQAGLERTSKADPYYREASLQLAEYYVDRWQRDRNPADADRAEALSFNAVNSYYTRKGSFEQRGHLLRRAAILEITANRPGNRFERYREMLEIADRTGLEINEGLEALKLTAASGEALIAYGHGSITLEALNGALAAHISHARFAGTIDDRSGRIADAVEHVAVAIGRVQFAGESISELDEIIQDAHNAASQAAAEHDASRPDDAFYVAQARGHLALTQACATGKADIMSQAASFLGHAVAVGRALGLSDSHMIPALSMARKAATFNEDRDAANGYCIELISKIIAFDQALAVNQTPESVVLRERLVAPEIGPIALNASSPEEIAWRIAMLRQTSIDDSKAEWARKVERRSAEVTLLFIAQSIEACSAVVVTDGKWTTHGIPLGSAEQFSSSLRPVAQAAESQLSLGQRRGLLKNVMSATKTAFAALTTHIPHDRPVLVVDTGLMHWLPLAGALTQLLPEVPGVAGIDLPTTFVDIDEQKLLDVTAVLVAPGNEATGGPAYLPNALDDADYIDQAISGTQRYFEPELRTTIDAVQQSTTAFVIAHGEADIRSPLDSYLGLLTPFTAKDALALQRSSLSMAVLASCESFGLDGDVVEARFGIGTALLRAGTKVVVDCKWRVSDEVASTFTRALAKRLAAGQSVISAFGAAFREVPHASDHFQLRFSGIPTW